MTQVETLAKYAARASFADLSAESRRQLPIHILDSLGCCIAALGADPIEACWHQVAEFGGGGPSALIGGGKANPIYAAGSESNSGAANVGPHSIRLAELELEPAIDWAAGFREVWRPGEEGAREHLRRFQRLALSEYPLHRDRPDLTGTSRQSPHLHFGEVSPGDVLRAIMANLQADPKACEAYRRQLVWREFAYHLLYHFPATAEQPLRSEFAKFPWRMQHRWFDAWKRGATGYPLVDAGMRELWHTGWMHNRVRMVTASFLVKHLLISWKEGAKWFWDTLVDADLANNTFGWQWVAGSGAYVTHWVPEVESAPIRAPSSITRTCAPGRSAPGKNSQVRRFEPLKLGMADTKSCKTPSHKIGK